MSKIKFEDIRDATSFHNWKLVSKEYKNLNTEMEFLCPEGHIVHSTWKKIRDNFICPICEETNKVSNLVEIKPKSKETTRIISIDDATNISGWAVYDNKKLVTFGKIEFTQKDTVERISRMRQWLINMIDNWHPDKIAIEDIQLQKFTGASGHSEAAVTTYKVLAQLQGALLVTCYEKNIPCTIVHTATWRTHCKIKAKSRADQKRAAQLFVQNQFGQNATQDEADAICIGFYMVDKYMKNNDMIEFSSL